MTAIGFVLFFVGGLIFDFSKATEDRFFKAFGLAMLFVGALLIFSGITVKLWDVMP